MHSDLLHTARALRRSPAFTLAALLSLALGIGATTAVSSIADTVFLRPLPYPNAERLFWVAIRFPSVSFEFVPSPDYVAWRRDERVFENLAATQAHLSTAMLLGGPHPAEVAAARVSANFLDTFRIAPALGRTFNAAEELPNGPKSVLLTHRFWLDHFQARRDILGSAIILDGQPYTVIGILPRAFIYPVDVKIDLLTTLPVSPAASHRDRSMSTWAVFGRLKPGVTQAQARADLDRLFAASKADDPKMFRADNSVVLQPLREHRAGNVRALLLILIGAAACLLAIACANVANLLLARWSSRARELAVRTAVGASRAHLTRQLFAEIAVLIAAGALAGMLLVAAALRGFVHLAAGELPRLTEVRTDFRVFAIALGISLVTALIFGALPAFRAGRVDLHAVLQQAGRASAGASNRLLRRTLVIAEVALSLVLTCGALLLFESLWHMQNDRLGFRPEHALTVSVPVRGAVFDEPARDALASDLLGYLRRIPGAEAAALTQCTPVSAGVMSVTFSRSGRPVPEPFHRGDSIGVCGVGPDYLKAAGTRLLAGRFFIDDDWNHPGSLAVLNETAARAYFPGEIPLGRQILGGRAGPWKTVIGVVADSRNAGLNHPPIPQAFINDTSPAGAMDLLFLVRTLAGEDALARALREELQAHHPGLIAKTETLDETLGAMTASPRFHTVLLSTFAAIAFLMGIVGVYGLLAYAVVERREEMGIRMALGATPANVTALVMREGALLAASGAAAGVAAALLLTRYLATLLYGVTATDPRTYAAVVTALMLTAAAASYLPARRAAALDPVGVLRGE